MLSGPLSVSPCGYGYTFEGPTRFDRLFTGLAIRVPDFMQADAGMGLEDVQATIDADYSELLERAYGQWVASPKGLAPFSVTGSVVRPAA